jgi:uncharacterized surface protein with fasciclin (FAS1) repeats
MTRGAVVPALLVPMLLSTSCAPRREGPPPGAPAQTAGQAAVADEGSQKSVARIALDSQDHTTLVTALKAVNWLDALANPGPFTVFAPVNAAFDKLPAGTVESLLKPENAAQLRTILLHHVLTSVYEPKDLTGGMSLPMLAGGPARVGREAEVITVDGAKVIGSVRGGNGIVYVLDAVLLPKDGK